jgi:beta-lactamase class A
LHISRSIAIFLRIFSAALILAAAGLAFYHFQAFSQSQQQPVYQPASIIAGIPVGGLSRQEAIDRLTQAYAVPVELHLGGDTIQARPVALGFELNMAEMMAIADQQQSGKPLWDAFWDYLWQRQPGPVMVPLLSNDSADQIRAYLNNEIAVRYDQPATMAMPVPGSNRFVPGTPGVALDIEPAVPLIQNALNSLSNRSVPLTTHTQNALPPLAQNLTILLQQNIELSSFAGITELDVVDLKTGAQIHFAYQAGKTIPPDISFTAASTIKIAIMVAIFKRTSEPTPQSVLDDLSKMIEVSENDPADQVMQQVIDKNLGPLEVTKDLEALGLKNTFLAGYFYRGAPLLKKIVTPGNQRKDYYTDPDPYNQTSPADMGTLLTDIYQCAANGGGEFSRVFPGQISQNECKQMIELLFGNHTPNLLAAGPPDGTKVAHKHGWVNELDGVVHTYCDAAIIYTPGGDFVMTAYMWDKNQVLFETANQLMADLSLTVYNYFNIPK